MQEKSKIFFIDVPNIYLTKAEACQYFKIKTRTLDKRIAELKNETKRYGERAVIKDGGIVLIHIYAFTDYLSNRERLLSNNLRKSVKDYDPGAVAKDLCCYVKKEIQIV